MSSDTAIVHGDVLEVLAGYSGEPFQLIIADPPYFQVLLDQAWDRSWKDEGDYLAWTKRWVAACRRVLKPDGLLYIFGQLGKREHVWLHVCSLLAAEMQFHDMIIWDRAVGYNERSDSFTPQYEMILVLRQSPEAKPYFDKSAVRIPYDEKTIREYLRDNRYKDRSAREAHLRKGKYATNIWRIPSLKGTSKEKVGHPSQKPLALVERIVLSSSRPGDLVLDPFLGSGTTAVVCERHGRRWMGIESNEEYVALAGRRVAGDAAEGDLFATPITASSSPSAKKRSSQTR
jgi:DNA modification methylase